MKSISVTSKINGKRMKVLRSFEGGQAVPACREGLHSALARWEFDASTPSKPTDKTIPESAVMSRGDRNVLVQKQGYPLIGHVVRYSPRIQRSRHASQREPDPGTSHGKRH